MKIGYTNSDIKQFLEDRTSKNGVQWSLVASFDKNEWQDLVTGIKSIITKKVPETLTDPDLSTCLMGNGLMSHVLGSAGPEYEDYQLIKDFIHVCGHIITPSMSVLELPGNKIAVIFAITRKSIKENMSPKRKIDI